MRLEEVLWLVAFYLLVVFSSTTKIANLSDSKKLTKRQREAIFPVVKEKVLAYSFGRASPSEIDQINIFQATLLSMKRAIESLPIKPDLVLVDGKYAPCISYPVKPIIKGDLKVPVISAASILAKVTRDKEMDDFDKDFPEYGFSKHKGYGTKEHIEAIKKYGITPIHRTSFAPMKYLI